VGSLLSIDVMSQLAREHEESLREVAIGGGLKQPALAARRWIGRQLVRTGTWLAHEPPMRPARVH
jgi:hypothetical protein